MAILIASFWTIISGSNKASTLTIAIRPLSFTSRVSCASISTSRKRTGGTVAVCSCSLELVAQQGFLYCLTICIRAVLYL